MARNGKDLSHEIDSQLVRAIKTIITEETKNFIRKTAKKNAEKIVDEVDKILSLTPSTLTYTDVKIAA